MPDLSTICVPTNLRIAIFVVVSTSTFFFTLSTNTLSVFSLAIIFGDFLQREFSKALWSFKRRNAFRQHSQARVVAGGGARPRFPLHELHVCRVASAVCLKLLLLSL